MDSFCNLFPDFLNQCWISVSFNIFMKTFVAQYIPLAPKLAKSHLKFDRIWHQL